MSHAVSHVYRHVVQCDTRGCEARVVIDTTLAEAWPVQLEGWTRRETKTTKGTQVTQHCEEHSR